WRRSGAPSRRGAYLSRQFPFFDRAEYAGRRQAQYARPLRRADARLHRRARRQGGDRQGSHRRPGDESQQGGKMKRFLILLFFFSVAAQGADKVKVGFISTLSGPNASIGTDIRDAFLLAVKLNGGKLGGLPAEVLV